jgi:hypothetical protein
MAKQDIKSANIQRDFHGCKVKEKDIDFCIVRYL